MKVALGQTEMMVNPIGFGGIPIQRLSMAESDAVVKKAVQEGINFFDTSRIYTDSEEKLGRIIFSVPREKIIIATKTFSRDGTSAIQDIETGLKFLRKGYIDLYQVHNLGNEQDLRKIQESGGVLEALTQAKQDGKIRYIGLTGHKPPILKKALEVFDFDTLQVPLNYIEQSCLVDLVPLAKKREWGLLP